MPSRYDRFLVFWIALPSILLIFSGCNFVGPNSIRVGRTAYSESITHTANQQQLQNIVHNRYGILYSQLSVASITANVSMKGEAGINLGFGNSSDYKGNLVPFSGTVTYEENPTIAYVPIQGEEFMRDFLTPVPLDMLMLMLTTMESSETVLYLLVKEVNGIPNYAFLHPRLAMPDPRFNRFVTLFGILSKSGVLSFVQTTRGEESEGVVFSLLFRPLTEEHRRRIREFLDLLNIPPESVPENTKILSVPVYLSLTTSNTLEIAISTRSLYEVYEIMAASVQVPEVDIQTGSALTYPSLGMVGQFITIKRLDGDEDPPDVSIYANYRNDWYYIDETDQTSKGIFKLAQWLWHYKLSASKVGESAPLLTLSVGGR